MSERADDVTARDTTPDPRPIDVSYRAWATPSVSKDETAPKTQQGTIDPRTAVQWMLTFDTETTIDAAQALTFGSYRLAYRFGSRSTVTVEEGLFHADDLPETNPAGLRSLRTYIANHGANVSAKRAKIDGNWTTPKRALTLMSRHEWVERVLWRAMLANATIVGFNLPFDLSRIATYAGSGIGENYGAFSLKVWDNDKYRPRIVIRHIDSKKSLISAGSLGERPEGWKSPRFLDVRTLAFALTSRGFSLASACAHWEVEHPKSVVEEHGVITTDYIDYNRRDVLATQELCTKLLDEFYSYAVPGLPPERALSPASIAKRTLAGLGVVGPLTRNPDFDTEILGASMQAFYGGRSEVRIRRVHLPVEVHDFTSMYPSVNTLMGLWSYLTADTITPDDATESVQALLDQVSADDCYDPMLWPNLVGIAQIIPDGDVLPVRGVYRHGENAVIGLNPLYSDDPTWFTIADLVASVIRTGKVPNIIRAVRFVTHGAAAGLSESCLGSLTINPTTDDLFTKVIELRKSPETDATAQALLKVIANAGAYGIFSEFRVTKHSRYAVPISMDVSTGEHEFVSPQFDAETPEAYCFPPIAACITGAARLMLALLEVAVVGRGGSWVFCDTDSMAIVCNETGSLVTCVGGPHQDSDGNDCVRALTPAQTADIRERFDTLLNPYDRSIIPNLLKREYAAMCFAISAKRYATYDLVDGKVLGHLEGGERGRVGTEHGLGHLLNPKLDVDNTAEPHDSRVHSLWTDDVWRSVVAADLGLPDDGLTESWSQRAALSRVTMTAPSLLNQCANINDAKVWRDQIKPFNFMNRLSVAVPISEPVRSLVGPYDSDPTTISARVWRALKTPDEAFAVYVTLERDTHASVMEKCQMVMVATMADVIRAHDRKPESKYLDPVTLQPCGSETRGLLRLTPTRVAGVSWIGKEIKNLDSVEQPIDLNDQDRTFYAAPDPWNAAAETLRRIGLRPLREIFSRADDERLRFRANMESRVSALSDRRQALKTKKARDRIDGEIAKIREEASVNIARVVPGEISDRQLRRLLNARECRPRPRLRRELTSIAERWNAQNQ